MARQHKLLIPGATLPILCPKDACFDFRQASTTSYVRRTDEETGNQTSPAQGRFRCPRGGSGSSPRTIETPTSGFRAAVRLERLTCARCPGGPGAALFRAADPVLERSSPFQSRVVGCFSPRREGSARSWQGRETATATPTQSWHPLAIATPRFSAPALLPFGAHSSLRSLDFVGTLCPVRRGF